MTKFLIIVFAVPLAVFAANIRDGMKIVGGSDAPRNEYIYQASLQRNYGDSKHFCGGVIIAKEWILTAAQCVATLVPPVFKVVVGSNKLSTGGETYSALAIYVHPLYNPYAHRHDLALVKVAPMMFTDTVGPIKIEIENVENDEELILTGWGSTSFPGSIPDNLQQINLRTIKTDFCKMAFPLVIDQQICTLNRLGEGACLEDSGSPLVRDDDGVKKLVGVLSFGAPCAHGIPDVSSRILSYVSWIAKRCNACI